MANLHHKNLLHLVVITLLFVLCACVKRDVIDTKTDLSYDEYQKKIFSKGSEIDPELEDDAELDEAPLPNVAPIMAEPQQPLFAKDKLITMTVTEDISLKEVLQELSRMGDIDMELDPEITGGIILKVTNKPLSDVIERICSLGKLRYSMNKNILKIEVDNNYIANYSLDFINMVRSGKSSSAIVNNLAATAGIGTNETGSNNEISSSYEGDLWAAIKDDLARILAYDLVEDKYLKADTKKLPKATISVNKQAGIISVYATARQHKDVKSYLERMRANVSAQVLIEAKVIEIVLTDEYKTGVNWNELDLAGKGIKFNAKFNAPTSALIDKTSLIALKTSSLPMVANNLKAVVDMSQQFGITKSIASPRIHAMNNQRAVLSFVTNQVYFTIQKEVVQAPATIGGITNPTIVTNSTLNTIPIGIVIAIQPSINLDTQEITMNVHPTITRPDGDPVPDPVTPDSTIPNVQIRELDSVLKIKSGQIMVIGGLMEDRIDNEDRGTPFLMQIPFLGNLAKSVRKNTKTVQTVIFIKATIIPTKSSPISSDRNVYNTFIKERDTNPWEFRK